MLAKELLKKNNFPVGRGRRSLAATAFLDKYLDEGGELEDYSRGKTKSAGSQTRASLFSTIHKVREENQMHIIDSEGMTYNLDFHSLCGKSIRQCNCSTGPQPPTWHKAESWSLQIR